MSSAQNQKQVLILHDSADTRIKIRDLINEVTSVAQITESNDPKDTFNRISRKTFDLIVFEYSANQNELKQMLKDIQSEMNEVDRPRNTLVLADALDFNAIQQKLRNITYSSKSINNDELKNYFLQTLATVTRTKIDASFIEPFIQATVKVLKVTCKTDAAKESVFLRQNDQASGDISAIIGMVSDQYKGSMGISFQKTTFLKIVSNMLGEEYKEMSEDIKDAAGEICNQVFGMAKTDLNSKGHRIQPAIPSIIAGDNHTIKHIVNGPCIAVKFKTDAGTFTVEAVIGGN